MKAEGGWGAVVNTEYCSIHPESDDTSRVSARIWDDGDVRNLAAMCDRVHEHDALAGIELWYGGPHAPCMETRAPAAGRLADPVETSSSTSCCATRTRTTSASCSRCYVDAAIRARDAGFDIVNVYGGARRPAVPVPDRRTTTSAATSTAASFENRARFWRETLSTVREAVGDDCAIASRFAVDHAASARRRSRSARTACASSSTATTSSTSGTSPCGDIAEWGAERRPVAVLRGEPRGPVHAARSRRQPHEQAGRRRRAHHQPGHDGQRSSTPGSSTSSAPRGPRSPIPSFPRRSRRAGSRTSASASAATCASRAGRSAVRRWSARRTPTAGEEYRRGWHPETFHQAENADKGVLVVGAGPAGMECAMVLGKRGMSAVHLVEADKEIGGCVNWISQLGHSDGRENSFRGTARGLGEWARIVNYRQIQLDKLRNVEVHLNSRLSAEEILEYGAEIVVDRDRLHGCATTGSTPPRTSRSRAPTRPWSGSSRPTRSSPATSRSASACWCSRTRATSWARRSPRSSRARASRSRSSRRPATSPATWSTRSRRRCSTATCTGWASTSAPSRCSTASSPGDAQAYNIWGPDHHDAIEFDSVVLCTQRLGNDELLPRAQVRPGPAGARGDRGPVHASATRRRRG